MTELKIQGEYIFLRYPTIMYEWEKSYWTKPKATDILGAINLNNSSVVYKQKYIQKKVVYGFELFEAKHTIVLLLPSGPFEIQFEDEASYASAVKALEHEYLY